MSEQGDFNQDGVIACPYCGDNVSALCTIETGMRLRLQQSSEIGNIPDAVCDGCLKQMKKLISKGAALRAEARAKEQSRLLLWKNRIALVKQGKLQLSQKNYAEAAASYEKYLRVLEVIYDLEAGKITPDILAKDGRSQELTVVASVYWDLMRVYDSSSRFTDRQLAAAAKLAEFVRFTPIFPHIMRRAESQARIAKNPEAYKQFLKLSNANRPRCFIATSAFDGQHTETIEKLCRFRDQRLKKHSAGRRFIMLYYRISPSLGDWLDRHPALKPTVRRLLTGLANQLSHQIGRETP
jgi:hypothetical protein